jgi:hypothetical protein
MTDSSQHLERLRGISRDIEMMQDESLGPAVETALRHSLYYLHLAQQFLGDTNLSPEIPVDLEGE